MLFISLACVILIGDMPKNAKADSASAQPAKYTKNKVAVVLMGTFIDTTWRMFLPTIGLMLIGMWIDNMLGTKYIFMILLFISGCLLAALLVRKQLKKIG